MRVLYAHLYDSGFDIGGAERVAHDLAKMMRERHKVEIAAAMNASKLRQEFWKFSHDVADISWFKREFLDAILNLNKLIKEFKPDICHSHHRYATFLLSFANRRGAKIIHTEHVLRHDKRFLFRSGHMATAVHETVRENLINYYHVKPKRVVTIPNAVNLPEPDANRVEAIKKKYKSLNEPINFLMIGRFEEQKGHHYLFEALKKMDHSERTKFRIFMAGNGALREHFARERNVHGLSDCVEILGHVTDIPEWLAYCDMLLLPSLFEGMPLSVLEAYASAIPVLATDIPGTRETVAHGETGFLVKVKDPDALVEGIRKSISDRERIKEMGHKAFEKSQTEYSYETMTDRYFELYNSLAKKAKK